MADKTSGTFNDISRLSPTSNLKDPTPYFARAMFKRPATSQVSISTVQCAPRRGCEVSNRPDSRFSPTLLFGHQCQRSWP